MAKINRIRINQAIQNIKHIAYLSELPTPSEDSADFVSINNVLYAKQVNNGVYSYAELGGGGTTVIEKTLNEEGTDFIDTFTEEDIDKLIGGALLKAKANEFASYYLTPMIAQQTDEGVKGVGLGGFLDTQEGIMLMVNVMTMNGQVRTQVYTTEGFAKAVDFNKYFPNTATNGTLYPDTLATLQNSDQNYIVFNNEIFKLADKQHNEGYLVYSHNGHDTTGCFFQKCITITISTLGWVLEEQENASKTYVDNAIGTTLQGDY